MYPRGRSFSRVKFHKFETENRHISAEARAPRTANKKERPLGRGCFAAWKRCHSIGRNRSSHGKRINSLAINESRPAYDCFLILRPLVATVWLDDLRIPLSPFERRVIWRRRQINRFRRTENLFISFCLCNSLGSIEIKRSFILMLGLSMLK